MYEKRSNVNLLRTFYKWRINNKRTKLNNKRNGQSHRNSQSISSNGNNRNHGNNYINDRNENNNTLYKYSSNVYENNNQNFDIEDYVNFLKCNPGSSLEILMKTNNFIRINEQLLKSDICIDNRDHINFKNENKYATSLYNYPISGQLSQRNVKKPTVYYFFPHIKY